MSTFKGKLDDSRLRFIAIDYFMPERYGCSAFFLSHVHWDHLKGMFDSKFIKLVNESADKYLYCSTFTAHLLTKFRKFAINTNKIIAMEVNKSVIIPNGNLDTDLVVTCLAAGHCPGSVMFLFEYAGQRILYTGDFRIRVDELKKMKGRLTNDDGTVIPIHELYLDTTFAFNSVLDDFPARESSEQLIMDQIDRWLWEVGSTLKVFISLPYRYGIEYLYINLSKKFRKPISVHNYDSYEPVEEIAPHVVSFEDAADDSWLIHACIQERSCPLSRAQDVKVIRPCALTFMNKPSKESLIIDPKYKVPFDDGHIWKVFYSSHCSLQELQDVVKFLQPVRIFPNVLVDRMTAEEIISLVKGESQYNLASGDSKKCEQKVNRRITFDRSGKENLAIRDSKRCDQTVNPWINFKKSREEIENGELEFIKKFKVRV